MFAIENGASYLDEEDPVEMSDEDVQLELENDDEGSEERGVLDFKAPPVKRHIGAVYRSGFMPSHRSLHSNGYADEMNGNRFSRIGRGRQFV